MTLLASMNLINIASFAFLDAGTLSYYIALVKYNLKTTF